MAVHPSRRSGGEVGHSRTHVVDVEDELLQSAEVDQVLIEQDVGHAGEQGGVAAHPWPQVLVGELGRTREDGVHHDELPAALLQGPQAPRPARSSGEAAVGLHRVGAQDDQEVGAVQVGYGQGVAVAVHEAAGQVLGALVECRGGVEVGRAQRRDEGTGIEQSGQIVPDRVAQIDRHRLGAVLVEDLADELGDLVERLVPGDRTELLALADDGLPQRVGVVVELT
jgi:hypothetical protein